MKQKLQFKSLEEPKTTRKTINFDYAVPADLFLEIAKEVKEQLHMSDFKDTNMEVTISVKVEKI